MEQFLCNGAETVIGFSEPIYVWDANLFVVNFFQCLLEGQMTVQDAITFLNAHAESLGLDALLEVCELKGNGNLSLYDYFLEGR